MTPRRALTLATVIAAGEGLLLLAVVASRGRVAAGAGFILALKLAFCWGTYRRGAGSFLALVLYEVAAVLYAAAATGTGLALRGAVAGAAVVVLALLARSTVLFPTPTLPKR